MKCDMVIISSERIRTCLLLGEKMKNDMYLRGCLDAVRVSTNESLSCIISMGSKPVVTGTFATPCGRTWSVYRNQNTRTTLEHLVRLM